VLKVEEDEAIGGQKGAAGTPLLLKLF